MTPAPVYVDPSEASRWEWAILEIKGKRPRTLAGRVRRDFELGVPMLRVEIPHGDLWRVHYFDAKAIFHIALTCEADVREQAARLDARVAPRIGGRRYRHVKRGSTYRVIGAASVQAATPIGEGDAVIVYQGESDGRVWVRPVGEFEDGRFVEADPLAAVEPAREIADDVQTADAGLLDRWARAGDGNPAPAFDFLAHLRRQREFSERTFGPGSRAKGVVAHIRKELTEIEADPTDLTEWIDVVILALDGAWRLGASPEAILAALVAKQAKNEARQWPDWRTADPNGAIEHVRSPSHE